MFLVTGQEVRLLYRGDDMSKTKSVAKKATTNETAIVTAVEVTNNESALTAFQTTNFFGYSLTIYGDVENPLFLASEVAEMIEYSGDSINKMLSMVDDDEKLNGKIFRSGQNREMWFLTEDGLYELLMRSTKPIAKDFKRAIKALLKDIRLERHKALLTTAEANSELIAKLERDLGSANLEIAMLSKTVATAREEYKTLSAKLQRQEKWSYELSEEKKRLEEANNLIRFRLKCITDENNGVYAFIEKNGAEKAQKYLANFPSLNIGA